MSKETFLVYLTLLIGVIVGWALCWLWTNIRKRWRKARFADAEYSDGKFRVIRQPRIFE